MESLGARRDILGIDSERGEDLEIDGVEITTGAANNEALEGGECEFSGGRGQEWQGAGNLVEKLSVEAVLLAFLSND